MPYKKRYGKKKYNKRTTKPRPQRTLGYGFMRCTFEVEEGLFINETGPNLGAGFMAIGEMPTQGVSRNGAGSATIDNKLTNFKATFPFIKTLGVSIKMTPTMNVTASSQVITSGGSTSQMAYAGDRVNGINELNTSVTTSIPIFQAWMDDKEHSRRYDTHKAINLFRKPVNSRTLVDPSGEPIKTNGVGYYDINKTPETGWHMFATSAQPLATASPVSYNIYNVRVRWYCILRGAGLSQAPP